MPSTGNTQQQINYGATANDGTGDPLRTAFVKTDENFDNIWLAGPVGSNVTIVNNNIQANDTNGNIVIKPNGVGVIQANAHIVPNIDSARDLGTANLAWRRIYVDTLNTADLSVAGNLDVSGNLTVDGDIIQIGNLVTDAKTIQLANTAATDAAADGSGITVGASDDVATLLYDSGNNVWTTNIGIQIGGPITGTSVAVSDATIYGNVDAINGNFTGNVAANYFIGNGALLTGITSYGNANAVSYGEAGWSGNIIPSANATYSLGNATNYWSNLWVANNTIYIGGVPLGVGAGNVLTVNGNAVLQNNSNSTISTTGNITAGNVSATGNVSGAYVKGNGSELTNLPAPVVTQDISSTGAMSIMLYDGNIKYNNYATVEPSSGNITGGNLLTSGLISATGNITGGNISTTGNIDALYIYGDTTEANVFVGGTANILGNVTANYFIGDGSQLTGLPAGYSDANVATFLAAYGSNTISTTGNVTAGNFIGAGSNVELIAQSEQWVFDTTGNLTLPTGGYLLVQTGIIGAGASPAPTLSGFSSIATTGVQGNISASGNLLAAGYANITGNINGSGATFSGNVTAQNFVGNISITGNVQGTSANVDLVAGSYTWTFNNAGNLVLPGNTFAVNYANGTAVTLDRIYLLEAYANVTYTLPGSFTEDPCRYSIVSSNVNVSSSWFDTSTYTFTPQKAGYWEITASYDIYRNAEASMAIKKNNSIVASAGSFNAVAQQITKIIYLNGSTDYIDIVNVGGAALSRSQYDSRSWFQARWIGE